MGSPWNRKFSVIALSLVIVLSSLFVLSNNVKFSKEESISAFATGDISCVGKCGKYIAGGNCWCDDVCVEYGDCCSDRQSACGGATPTLSGNDPCRDAAHPNDHSCTNFPLKQICCPDGTDCNAQGTACISTACDPSKMECDTNREGSNFYNYETNNPEDCRHACNTDINCKAWTYVKPVVQGAQGHCWKKTSVPSKTSDTCCASGFNCLDGMECNTDYYGSDIASAWFQSRDPKACQDACNARSDCVAWTWVKEEAFCYMKNAVPGKGSGVCCTSGVK